MPVKIVVIDGQGGALGGSLVSALKGIMRDMEAAGGAPDKKPWEILAIGANSAATVAMLGAGADAGATGENPAVVACRGADIIAGPLGIVMANSMLGEITPAIARAVGESAAKKILIPVSKCGAAVAGVAAMPYAEYVKKAAEMIADEAAAICGGRR
jgi:hypothetical protein